MNVMKMIELSTDVTFVWLVRCRVLGCIVCDWYMEEKFLVDAVCLGLGKPVYLRGFSCVCEKSLSVLHMALTLVFLKGTTKRNN